MNVYVPAAKDVVDQNWSPPFGRRSTCAASFEALERPRRRPCLPWEEPAGDDIGWAQGCSNPFNLRTLSEISSEYLMM